MTTTDQTAAEIAPHLIQNCITFVLVALAIAGIIRVLRHPYWGIRMKGLWGRTSAMVTLAVIVLFVMITVMDSIAWLDADPGKDIGVNRPRTILDRGFARAVGVHEKKFKEDSYGAPMAKVEFTDPSRILKYKHLMGTSQTGYDTFYRILKGVKPAVIIGTLPLIIAVPLSLLFGVSAGFFGGRVDDFVVYIYTTLASIPGILLLIALIAALGQGLPQIAFGLGVTGWVGLCRLVRGETLKLRELEYVQASRCLGVSQPKIIIRHIIPNLMHIVIITAILAFTGLVLTESVLAYLGIGLDNSWGAIIDEARGELARDPVIWWNIVFASFFLFLLVLCVNVFGDALRDVLDPKTSAG
jgi:peptide/nickel transport system permease protein